MRLDVPSFVSSNWPIKVTALALATVLWAAVAAEQPTTQLVPIQLEIQTPAARTLLQEVPPIRALFAGSARELIKLSTAAPPTINKVIPDTLTQSFFTIDLSPQDVTIASDADVDIQDILPRRLVVALDEVLHRPVRVVSRVTINAAPGFVLMRLAVSPESLMVIGPKAQVERIGSVFTVPAEWTDVTAPVSQKVAIDTAAFGVVQLSQYEVEVTGRIERVSQRILDDVPVVIAGGEWESIPPTLRVTVSGPLSRLGRITSDSLLATAPAPAAEGDMVPVSVRVPRGLSASVSPDSVRALRVIL